MGATDARYDPGYLLEHVEEEPLHKSACDLFQTMCCGRIANPHTVMPPITQGECRSYANLFSSAAIITRFVPLSIPFDNSGFRTSEGQAVYS